MFSTKVLLISLVLFFSHYIHIHKVTGVCCEHKFLLECGLDGTILSVGHERCGDCTSDTRDCGIGECNILGCECKKGCRTGNCKKTCDSERSKRQSEDFVDLDSNAGKLNDEVTDFIIEAADTDGDGYLNVTEAKFYVYRKQPNVAMSETEVEEKLGALDRNSDGYLSSDEIDSEST